MLFSPFLIVLLSLFIWLTITILKRIVKTDWGLYLFYTILVIIIWLFSLIFIQGPSNSVYVVPVLILAAIFLFSISPFLMIIILPGTIWHIRNNKKSAKLEEKCMHIAYSILWYISMIFIMSIIIPISDSAIFFIYKFLNLL